MASLDDLMRLGDPDEIRATIRSLKSQLAEARAEIESVRFQLDQALGAARDMKLRAESAERERAELEAECERLRRECAVIKTAFYQRAEVRNLQSRLEASEAECKELRAGKEAERKRKEYLIEGLRVRSGLPRETWSDEMIDRELM